MEQKPHDMISEYENYFEVTNNNIGGRRDRDGMGKIVIFDLDGVLADIRHRLHHIEGENHNWIKFFSECVDDKPNRNMIELLISFIEFNYKIYILSGRSESVREKTMEWFDDYRVPIDFMFLRPGTNYLPASILKREWLKKIIETEGKDNIFMVFDDEEKNVKMYRDAGIQSFHVVINYE